jgi:single-strand DNA-binding protein
MRFEVLGRVGKDPKVDDWNGIAKTSINIAVTNERKDKEGNRIDQTSWFYLTVWNKTGEILGKYVKKGDLLLCSGNVTTKEIEGEDGENRRTIYNFNVNDFSLLGKPSSNGNNGGSQKSKEKGQYTDEDVPF